MPCATRSRDDASGSSPNRRLRSTSERMRTAPACSSRRCATKLSPEPGRPWVIAWPRFGVRPQARRPAPDNRQRRRPPARPSLVGSRRRPPARPRLCPGRRERRDQRAHQRPPHQEEAQGRQAVVVAARFELGVDEAERESRRPCASRSMRGMRHRRARRSSAARGRTRSRRMRRSRRAGSRWRGAGRRGTRGPDRPAAAPRTAARAPPRAPASRAGRASRRRRRGGLDAFERRLACARLHRATRIRCGRAPPRSRWKAARRRASPSTSPAASVPAASRSLHSAPSAKRRIRTATSTTRPGPSQRRPVGPVAHRDDAEVEAGAKRRFRRSSSSQQCRRATSVL